MQDRSMPTNVLLTATFRLFARFLSIIIFFALACGGIYLASGASDILAVVPATFFALLFFAAPLACSAFRARRAIRLFTLAGGKSLLYCFIWGSVVTAGFLATLQVWQSMEATLLNYIAAMGSAGLFCAASATIPSGR